MMNNEMQWENWWAFVLALCKILGAHSGLVLGGGGGGP